MITAQSNNSPDCLASLPAPKTAFDPAHLVIENIDANVDTTPLRNWTIKSIGLAGGSYTNNQLDDLFANCQYTYVGGEVELPEKIDSTIPIPTLAFVGEEPFSIAGILDRLIVKKDHQELAINFPMLLEDWEAIVRASQYRNVQIYQPLPPEIFERDVQKGSLKRIQVALHTNPVTEPQLLKFIDHSGIVASYSGGSEQERWHMMFVFPNVSDGMWNKLQIPSSTDSEFQRLSREYGWAFGWDGAENITHLWMPDSATVAQHVKILGELKTLRMDVRGINGSIAVGSGLVDGNELVGLSKLESLYLPSEIQLNDLVFLSKLKELKHLQIASQDRTLQTGSGVEACSSLETIRMFAAPDTAMLSELGQLPSLRQLVIIDDKSELSTPDLVQSFMKRLPSVDVEVIAAEDFRPDLDNKFAEHIKRMRERLVQSVSEKKEQ